MTKKRVNLRTLSFQHEKRLQTVRKKEEVKANTAKTLKERRKQAVPSASSVYSLSQRILLVGEGNFSFAVALCRKFNDDGSGITATTNDSGSIVLQKYEDAKTHLAELGEAGAAVYYGVDATDLSGTLMTELNRRTDTSERFDRIVFNFPHVSLILL
eukprot:GHVR01001582.1.p1 GENE.GHVR01001582.1~~GHVR01001582.1.p1  ORF type:complete len:157 (+),score=14.66 GHVR01001582.1:48-518(+)